MCELDDGYIARMKRMLVRVEERNTELAKQRDALREQNDGLLETNDALRAELVSDSYTECIDCAAWTGRGGVLGVESRDVVQALCVRLPTHRLTGARHGCYSGIPIIEEPEEGQQDDTRVDQKS